MTDIIEPGLGVSHEQVGLPPRIFLYTLDQVAACLAIPEKTLRTQHVYFFGRSRGGKRPGLLLARNLAAPDKRPDWRVAETEFVRWMKHKRFVFAASNKLIS